MRNKKGFTLTEILLAVMIVGIIGVALAALTTAASRESGVGRSKIILRNNLSLSLQQIRKDIQTASRVLYVRGSIESAQNHSIIPLLILVNNLDFSGNKIIDSDSNPTYTTYCFEVGARSADPSDSLSGGTIYRRVSEDAPFASSGEPSCGNPSSDDAFEVLLHNVKFIPSKEEYPVPLFRVLNYDGTYNVKNNSTDYLTNLGSVLEIKLITELSTKPIVNDVVEELFVLPNGFQVNPKSTN